jgi:hypothetical protein
MGAMRNVMKMNIARSNRLVAMKCSWIAKLSFAKKTFQRCSPTSSGSSVDSAIALTGLPLARFHA